MPSNNTNYSYLTGINSFPTTKMESVNKLITENSLTRLINRLLDLDGYIITEQLAKANTESEVIGNGGSRLKINDDLNINSVVFRNGLFEFVIRGYYFSAEVSDLVGLINDYVTTQQPQTNVGLFARIFIDNSNPSYPELVGQTAYEDDQENFEEGKHYGVQFFVCPTNQKPEPYHPTLPVDPNTNVVEGLGTNYLYFDLMLLKYFKDDDKHVNGTYIPFNSMNKFDSHSIDIIDGGVLKLYNN